MFTRISKAVLVAGLLVLSACDRTESATAMPVDPKSADAVRCAVDGATSLQPVCRSEISGDVLTIRHPEGGFRRLLIVRDGHGLIAADGAEPAQVTITQGNRITVAFGSDRYDLPATITAAQ